MMVKSKKYLINRRSSLPGQHEDQQNSRARFAYANQGIEMQDMATTNGTPDSSAIVAVTAPSEKEITDDIFTAIGKQCWSAFSALFTLALSDTFGSFNNNGIVFFLESDDFACDILMENGTIVSHPNKCFIPGTTTKCTSFSHYNKHGRTLVTEFDLVCDREDYGNYSQFLKLLGSLCSSLLITSASDRFGRKITICLCMMLEIMSSFGQFAATDMIRFSLARFLTGFGSFGRFITSVVMINDWFGSEFQTRSAVIFMMGSTVGNLILMYAVDLVKDYKVILWWTAVLESVMLVIVIVFVKESPKFLLLNGHYKTAASAIRRILRRERNISENEAYNTTEAIVIRSRSVSIEAGVTCCSNSLHLLASSSFGMITRLLLLTSVIQTFISAAASFNLRSLGGPIKYSFLADNLASAATVFFLLIFSLSRTWLTRFMKYSMCIEVIGLLVLLVLSTGWITVDLFWYRIIAHVVFTMGRSAASKIMSLYGTNSYPPSLKSSASGIFAAASQIVSLSSPLMRNFRNHVWIPSAIYCICALINFACIYKWLPKLE